MSIAELPIHPLAQAALRYFTVPSAAEASELTEEAVLAEIGGALSALAPAELRRAGEDLLDVCRYFRDRERAEVAERIALVISKAAKSKLVAHGGVALLVPEGERATGALPSLEAASSPAETEPSLGVVERYWGSMSSARRERLALLAEQILARIKYP